jgi:hypothetical protein
LPEGADESAVGRRRQVRHAGNAGRRRHDAKASRPFDDDFIQLAFAAEHVLQRVARREAQQHVDIGEAKIAVEQHHAAPALRERDAKIHRHVGLADATLAAGDGDHLHRPGRLHAAQALRLVEGRLKHGRPPAPWWCRPGR